MPVQEPVKIAPAEGKLGILIPGMGAVAHDIHRRGRSRPARHRDYPSVRSRRLATVRLGKRTDGRSPLIKDFVPLADLNDLASAAGTSLKTTPTRPR